MLIQERNGYSNITSSNTLEETTMNTEDKPTVTQMPSSNDNCRESLAVKVDGIVEELSKLKLGISLNKKDNFMFTLTNKELKEILICAYLHGAIDVLERTVVDLNTSTSE